MDGYYTYNDEPLKYNDQLLTKDPWVWPDDWTWGYTGSGLPFYSNIVHQQNYWYGEVYNFYKVVFLWVSHYRGVPIASVYNTATFNVSMWCSNSNANFAHNYSNLSDGVPVNIFYTSPGTEQSYNVDFTRGTDTKTGHAFLKTQLDGTFSKIWVRINSIIITG